MLGVSVINFLGEIEHWDEDDSEMDADFSITPDVPSSTCTFGLVEDHAREDDKAIVLWVVAFTCTFQTLHSLSSRAVSWLLMFLGAMLTLFGQWSDKIARIALAFPSTLRPVP